MKRQHPRALLHGLGELLATEKSWTACRKNGLPTSADPVFQCATHFFLLVGSFTGYITELLGCTVTRRPSRPAATWGLGKKYRQWRLSGCCRVARDKAREQYSMTEIREQGLRHSLISADATCPSVDVTAALPSTCTLSHRKQKRRDYLNLSNACGLEMKGIIQKSILGQRKSKT